MVKAVHPLVKAIHPLVEAAYPLVVGKNTERIVNAAGESTERTQISAHWAEPEVVGVRGWCRSSVIVMDVTPLLDPLLRFQTRIYVSVSPSFQVILAVQSPNVGLIKASQCCTDDHCHPICTCHVGCLHSETAADVGVRTCLWPLDLSF